MPRRLAAIGTGIIEGPNTVRAVSRQNDRCSEGRCKLTSYLPNMTRLTWPSPHLTQSAPFCLKSTYRHIRFPSCQDYVYVQERAAAWPAVLHPGTDGSDGGVLARFTGGYDRRGAHVRRRRHCRHRWPAVWQGQSAAAQCQQELGGELRHVCRCVLSRQHERSHLARFFTTAQCIEQRTSARQEHTRSKTSTCALPNVLRMQVAMG